jgi:hypothetical protein
LSGQMVIFTAATPHVKPLTRNCAITHTQPYPPSGGGFAVD